MRQASKPGSWRILAVQTAWLTALWVVVAFVFGTEVYLTAPGPPVKVFWWVAFASAIHDWFPWILLSPVAVALAHRFRFERNSWRQSLAVHLAACLLFSLAYEGMEVLASRAPRMITTSGEMPGYGIIAAPPGLTTSF